MDNFFKAQLDKYYQHPQLTTYIAFLDSEAAWSLYKDSKNDDRAYEEQFFHRNIARLDTTLERLDERGLSLHKVVDSLKFGLKGDLRFLNENERICNEYRELLLGFLKSPARAGQHMLTGARFATAACYCLQHVSVRDKKTRYTKFLCVATFITHSFILVYRDEFCASPRSLRLALIYIRLLLPRSSRSEDLINQIIYPLMLQCEKFAAYDTRLAREAITTYRTRNQIPNTHGNLDHLLQARFLASGRIKEVEVLTNSTCISTASRYPLARLSAQHHNPQLPKEPAMRFHQ